MITEKGLLHRQVAPEHRHTNEDAAMLREQAVKLRRAGFPGIIPQVYKGSFSIAVHSSLSQHTLCEHTVCHSELDPGDGLMNTKRIGKNTVLGLFGVGKGGSQTLQHTLNDLHYSKRAKSLPRMKNQSE